MRNLAHLCALSLLLAISLAAPVEQEQLNTSVQQPPVPAINQEFTKTSPNTPSQQESHIQHIPLRQNSYQLEHNINGDFGQKNIQTPLSPPEPTNLDQLNPNHNHQDVTTHLLKVREEEHAQNLAPKMEINPALFNLHSLNTTSDGHLVGIPISSPSTSSTTAATSVEHHRRLRRQDNPTFETPKPQQQPSTTTEANSNRKIRQDILLLTRPTPINPEVVSEPKPASTEVVVEDHTRPMSWDKPTEKSPVKRQVYDSSEEQDSNEQPDTYENVQQYQHSDEDNSYEYVQQQPSRYQRSTDIKINLKHESLSQENRQEEEKNEEEEEDANARPVRCAGYAPTSAPGVRCEGNGAKCGGFNGTDSEHAKTKRSASSDDNEEETRRRKPSIGQPPPLIMILKPIKEQKVKRDQEHVGALDETIKGQHKSEEDLGKIKPENIQITVVNPPEVLGDKANVKTDETKIRKTRSAQNQSGEGAGSQENSQKHQQNGQSGEASQHGANLKHEEEHQESVSCEGLKCGPWHNKHKKTTTTTTTSTARPTSTVPPQTMPPPTEPQPYNKSKKEEQLEVEPIPGQPNSGSYVNNKWKPNRDTRQAVELPKEHSSTMAPEKEIFPSESSTKRAQEVKTAEQLAKQEAYDKEGPHFIFPVPVADILGKTGQNSKQQFNHAKVMHKDDANMKMRDGTINATEKNN